MRRKIIAMNRITKDKKNGLAIDDLKMISSKIKKKPHLYHFTCNGGGTVRMVDTWRINPHFKCKYQGDKNWLTPACEKCEGLNEDSKRLEYPDHCFNRGVDSFLKEIIEALDE